jgi:RNase adapter protein RapZ
MPQRSRGCCISEHASSRQYDGSVVADIVLITGLSGAGRSGAAAVLEDLGWYVIDNLPTSLVDTIVELASKPGSDIERLALVSGRQHIDVLPKVAALRGDGHRVRIVFLSATTAELVKRYDSSRRKHPLDAEAQGLVEAIELERSLLDPVRSAADLVIDTTELNIHQLKAKLIAAFDQTGDGQRLQIAVESFGYKYGLPLDADIIMDVRFLPNPHWEEALRPLTGHDRAVRDFVLERSHASQFLDQFESMMVTLVPAYEAEGKTYLTIAMGCTGGRHRSVAVAEDLAERLRARGIAVTTGHRDIAR